jgi:hypothetical protein
MAEKHILLDRNRLHYSCVTTDVGFDFSGSSSDISLIIDASIWSMISGLFCSIFNEDVNSTIGTELGIRELLENMIHMVPVFLLFSI